MIPQSLLLNTRVFGSRDLLLRFLASRQDHWDLVAEVGVAFGGFSRLILDTLEPHQMHAFDLFGLHEMDWVFGSPPSSVMGNRTHLDYYHDQFPGVITYQGNSWERLAECAGDMFDFVYVDGAHDYDPVKKDIEQLKRVVQSGGVIMFDDYTNYDVYGNEPFGVMQAVNEYIEEGHKVLGLSLNPGGFHNIAVEA